MNISATPFFSPWRYWLQRPSRSVSPSTKWWHRATLTEIERECAAGLPDNLFTPPPIGLNSRQRIYTLSRTFWCFLWQVLQRQASCREVVRQVQALFQMHDHGAVDAGTSAYCQARQRLPLSLLESALAGTARHAERVMGTGNQNLQGRAVKVVDGTTLTLTDTTANQRHYPQMANQQPGCGFPLLKLVVLFSLRSGAILARHDGNKHMDERQGLQACHAALSTGDILLGDRRYGNFVVAVWATGRGVDLIARVPTGSRHVDFRQGRRLGPTDRLVAWHKLYTPAAGFSSVQWAAVPDVLPVRIIRTHVVRAGFRTRQITLVTTLLDPIAYPAEEILHAYLQRWALELCLDDLKTTLGMQALRCQTPTMVQKELMAFLIAHNLLRWIMAQAAQQEGTDLRRISFKGTVDALRHFQIAMTQTGTRKKRQILWRKLLRIIATDLVPYRPDRREPRAVKHRRKYPQLTRPRHIQRDRPTRNARRARSKRRLI
jgi:hypothetical protein